MRFIGKTKHVLDNFRNPMSLIATSTKPRRVGLNVLKLFLGGPKRRCLSTHANPDTVESDIVIVGGGPAGLALASALGGYSRSPFLFVKLRKDRIFPVYEKKLESYSDRKWKLE